jgi:hypothetical protein
MSALAGLALTAVERWKRPGPELGNSLWILGPDSPAGEQHQAALHCCPQLGEAEAELVSAIVQAFGGE